ADRLARARVPAEDHRVDVVDELFVVELGQALEPAGADELQRPARDGRQVGLGGCAHRCLLGGLLDDGTAQRQVEGDPQARGGGGGGDDHDGGAEVDGVGQQAGGEAA